METTRKLFESNVVERALEEWNARSFDLDTQSAFRRDLKGMAEQTESSNICARIWRKLAGKRGGRAVQGLHRDQCPVEVVLRNNSVFARGRDDPGTDRLG